MHVRMTDGGKYIMQSYNNLEYESIYLIRLL